MSMCRSFTWKEGHRSWRKKSKGHDEAGSRSQGQLDGEWLGDRWCWWVIEDAILDESTQTVLGKPILHTETEKWNI